jgi:DNA primase
MDTSKVDLIALTGVSLKKTSNTNGGEWHGECPFCGGKDRFWVAPNDKSGRPMAFCRGCKKSWDAIAFIQERENLDFKAACQYLNLALESGYRPAPKRPAIPTVKDTDRDKPANDPEWQKMADSFVWKCINTLNKPTGKVALDYLLGRGLTYGMIEIAGLGYNPSGYENEWGGVKVYLPMGITIPWELGGRYTALRVRRQGAKPDQEKYAQAAGMMQSLYYAWHWKQHPFTSKSIAVLVEGEFDCLAIQSALFKTAYQHIIPCAVGSVTNGRTLANVLALSQAQKVLVAFDNDKAGHEHSQFWIDNLPNAVRHCPTAHDPNDMLVALGWESVIDWICGGINGN